MVRIGCSSARSRAAALPPDPPAHSADARGRDAQVPRSNRGLPPPARVVRAVIGLVVRASRFGLLFAFALLATLIRGLLGMREQQQRPPAPAPLRRGEHRRRRLDSPVVSDSPGCPSAQHARSTPTAPDRATQASAPAASARPAVRAAASPATAAATSARTTCARRRPACVRRDLHQRDRLLQRRVHGGKCAQPTCGNQGGSCMAATDCCSHDCHAGSCNTSLCKADGASCQGAADCCSGDCISGACGQPAPTCKANGGACASANECCAHLCTTGTCGNGSQTVTGKEQARRVALRSRSAAPWRATRASAASAA